MRESQNISLITQRNVYGRLGKVTMLRDRMSDCDLVGALCKMYGIGMMINGNPLEKTINHINGRKKFEFFEEDRQLAVAREDSCIGEINK